LPHAFAPPPVVAVPVAGSDLSFPVRRIYCVGRNYAEHAREMGFSDREPPFFFQKPTDAIVHCAPGATIEIPYPMATRNLHHEIELVAAIGRAGRRIPMARALEHVWGYAVGLDMTRRDCQFAMRDKGRPWEIGKAFDQSAPIGSIHAVSAVGHVGSGRIELDVDGQTKQSSDVAKLIWNVAETIEHLSGFFELRPGDLVYTGTPEGVGAVQAGSLMVGRIDGLGEIRLRLVAVAD
jgi:fumarylpyruvate hydrolase